MVLKDEVFQKDTLYVEYVVQNGERPEEVSKKIYDDEQYYWVILQINGITDYYNQWPLSLYELERYINKKYGGEAGAAEVHHYETVQVANQDGQVLLPAGLHVPANYVFTYPDDTNEADTTDDSTIVELTSFPVPVTNQEYEIDLNQKKSRIQVLDFDYIYDYEREYRLWHNSLPAQKSFVDISQTLDP